MIKCENGKCEMEGSGSLLTIEMAIIINTFKECLEENADYAMELAVKLSDKDTMDQFTLKEVAEA